ncbi:MAG: peptidase T [Clostridia bacterium]|nr:peptidase T [Clostridia bacterium]
METVIDRFLRYVSFDTQSDHESETTPSTDKQKALARQLVKELLDMGVKNARMDEYGYVYASIPANVDGVPSLGFIAHMDTSPDAPGANIVPRIVANYDGGDIQLNGSTVLSSRDYPRLAKYAGTDMIVTDGTTLLGADDKAGIAEIMTLAAILAVDPTIEHGEICIAFTPDEEVGRGTDKFDVEGFGAQFAYTVDGGELGTIEYENFNAATAKVRVRGLGIHPGGAKNHLINSIHVAKEFDAMLPAAQRPEYTEGYEGFIHLTSIEGDIESTSMSYIIRDHDMDKFRAKKALMEKAAEIINLRYGEVLQLAITDSYFNMREMIEPHMGLITSVQDIMRDLGITPITTPVRGGTDGARLSFMGLPCPNICTGGMNYHGRYECIPVQSMEKVCDVLLEIVRRFR